MNNKKEQQREELHKTIWKIANELRGSVDGWDFKQYVLGLLFYRFISENIEHYVNENQRKAGLSNFEYRNISDEKALMGKTQILEEKGFDYVALGHIHKRDYNSYENQKIVYPGSTISLGFDELGEHGMIVGNLDNEKNLNLKFVPLDEEQFTKVELYVDNIYSKEELIEKINEIEVKENEYVEIVIKGGRNFEIDKYDILKYVKNERIIKLKDETKLAYDLEKLANETTLRGLFVKEMIEKLKNENNTEEEKEIIEKAIEIGLNSLE